jgi:DNA-binding CsgD family transcriptional regulator
MNILIIAYLVSAFVGFESALFVYRLNRLSKTNRIYTAFALSHALFSIIMIQFLLSPDEQACWLWSRVFTFIACISMILRVRYFMELAGIKVTQKRLFLAAFYALPFIVALPIISFWPVIAEFVRFPWGWGLAVKKSVWTLLFYSYMMGSGIICMTLAIYWRFKSETLREKKQADIVILSSMAGIIALAHLFFPADHLIATHALFINFYNIFCFVILVFGIRYAIKKYGLMTITPANPASELFEGMHEALFIINTHGEIIFLNENARILAKRSVKEAETGSIFSLFASPAILKHEIDELIHSRELKHPVILSASENTGCILLETSLLGVKNEIGELIGIIVIIREAGGIPSLQKQHSLSQREIEILLLLCNGLSSQEIAEECEITLLTAKTHIHNIYQKTGLKNRVELSNLLNQHL